MTPKKYIFAAATLFSACTFGLHAQSVWFDTPTSLKGASIWYGGHPERYSSANKPVRAGDSAYNPDQEWEGKSLPIGNGSIGANVMGSVEVERYTLNEKTLWRGGPGTGRGADKGTAKGAAHYWDVNVPAARVLPEIRQAFADGDFDKAARLTRDNFHNDVPYEADGEPEFRFGSFTTLGELLIETGHDAGSVKGYRRALSLDSAVATVSYQLDGVSFTRSSFISYPANAMVVRFAASERGKQNLTLRYNPSPVSEGRKTAMDNDGIVYEGRLDNNGMQYVVRLKAVVKGGTVSNANGKLSVKGADEVVFVLTADTDYKPNYDPDFNDPKAYVGVDPVATTQQWMKQALKQGYKRLLKAHLADYGALYNRVKLDLGSGVAESALPTGQRLAAYRKGVADHTLEALYFQYGRYLLIASSRPGNLPANLQGIWHNNVDGPWRVDYHNNINLQMNYWPALSTNLSECAEPLADFIRLLEKPGRATAKAYWGARGWAAGISAIFLDIPRRSAVLICRGTITRWPLLGWPRIFGTTTTIRATRSFCAKRPIRSSKAVRNFLRTSFGNVPTARSRRLLQRLRNTDLSTRERPSRMPSSATS